MIRAENLGYDISGKTLLADISATFKEQEISLIVGPNGAGKSTLIKLLSQQLSPSEGTVWVDDENVKSITKAELATRRAVLSQSVELAFPLTIKEVVMMGRYPHFSNQPGSKDREICAEAMAFFEVDTMVHRNYLTLSGGEKQRVQFARVAAQIWPDDDNATKYLLLDEPLAHLDIHYQYDFMAKLQALMDKQPMVVIGVVHDLNLAYRFAHQVLLLHQGKLMASGAPARVFTNQNMQVAFLREPSFFENEEGERFLCF